MQIGCLRLSSQGKALKQLYIYPSLSLQGGGVLTYVLSCSQDIFSIVPVQGTWLIFKDANLFNNYTLLVWNFSHTSFLAKLQVF